MDYGNGKLQKTYVKSGQRVLEKHKIGINSIENLVWAPNIKGLHTIKTLKPLVKEWRSVHLAGLGRKQIVAVLQKHGKIARDKTS